MAHGLELGALDLASGGVHEDGYTLSVLADGATFGGPQAGVREIVSMLADGNLVTYDRAGNRVAEFTVLIEGADGVALQAGEVALRRELYRPNTVTWMPPADFSAPTVYQVVTSDMSPLFDDIDEMKGRRKFRVTLTCAPFARSLNPVTIAAMEAPAPTPTSATITNADTTTGFTATIADYYPGGGLPLMANVVTDEGAYAQTSGSGYWLSLRMIYTPAAPVSMTSTTYLVVEVSGSPSPRFRLTINGVEASAVPALSVATSAGTVKFVFDTAGGSLSKIALGFDEKSSTPVSRTINVHDISRTDTLPQVTKRQTTRTVDVLGTERTPASVHVQSPDGVSNLGMTIVHTSPEDDSGYAPPLRRWRVSGATTPTADSSTMSGAREPITVANPFVAEVPNLAVPEGGYLLAARLRIASGTAATINWATDTRIDGVAEGYVTDYVTVDFPSTGTWFFVPIAAVTLPSVRSMSGKVRILLSSATAELDEAWIYRVDDGCALSWVHNVTKPHLWLDPPDLTSSVRRIWVGADAGRADASHPGANLGTHSDHTFAPDRARVFTATAGVENPAADLTYFPLGHSNAPVLP